MKKAAAVWFLAWSALLASGAESLVSTNMPKMEVRFYELQTNAFYSNLKFEEPLRSETNFYLLRGFFLTNGVDLRPPIEHLFERQDWLFDRLHHGGNAEENPAARYPAEH